MMLMTIKKWGNSLATRIPKSVVEAVNLRLDQEVDVKAVNGKIIITPITKKKEYKLEELLGQCKPESMKRSEEDQEWLNTDPVGREIW
ncbi:MAG: AbrB/MazE/SpoVT family DNA-binding domain-containing protein [Desulfobacterales bacterium]|nr:MAG: AbrB/MazE/SpoVT family DNA-binding domain-containing protein [Desulfobacterales bacterium]